MDNRKPRYHTISMLETIAMLIDKQYEHTDEHYNLYIQAKDKPHVLDNATVDRSIMQYEREKEYLEYYNKQLSLWRKEKLTASQDKEVTRLEKQMVENTKLVNDTLKLVKEVRKGTIDEILEMNELELMMKFFKDKEDGKI
jgi:hypothetical protein